MPHASPFGAARDARDARELLKSPFVMRVDTSARLFGTRVDASERDVATLPVAACRTTVARRTIFTADSLLRLVNDSASLRKLGVGDDALGRGGDGGRASICGGRAGVCSCVAVRCFFDTFTAAVGVAGVAALGLLQPRVGRNTRRPWRLHVVKHRCITLVCSKGKAALELVLGLVALAAVARRRVTLLGKQAKLELALVKRSHGGLARHRMRRRIFAAVVM